MGLIGIIKHLGLSASSFKWLLAISVIVLIILLYLIIFGDSDIFFTKIFYTLGALISGVIAVGAFKGMSYQQKITMLAQ